MGIEIDLRIHQCACQFLYAVRRTTLGKFMGEVLGVVGRERVRIHSVRRDIFNPNQPHLGKQTIAASPAEGPVK